MTRNILKNIIYIVLGLFLSLFVLLTSVELIVFDMKYYESQYEKNKIYEKVNIDKQDLMESTEKLLDYLKDKRENLDFKTRINAEEQEFFSPKDKLHMVDVKNLFVKGRNIRNGVFIFLLCFLFVIIIKRIKFSFGKMFILTSIVGIVPIIFLSVLINIDFYKYFTVFHEVFFDNDLWLLDPKVDRLVNIFPESFFYNTALKIIIFYLISQLIILILGFVLKKKEKNK